MNGLNTLTQGSFITSLTNCTKSLTDRLHIQERLWVLWLTNFCKGVCLFKSWFILGSSVLLFYDITKFIKILFRLPLQTVHSPISQLRHMFLFNFHHSIIVWKKFFSEYYCLEVALQNLIWLHSWWRTLKSSLQLTRPETNF